MNRYKIYIAALFLMTIIGVSSCKDDMMEEISTLNVSKTFSPTDLTATVTNKTGVKLTWKAVANAKVFTIEVSKNADFSGTPVKTISDITLAQVPYTITALDGNTQYYFRVKGVTTGIADSQWITAAAKTDAEQIFQELTAGKLTSRAITLNWPAGENVTNITVSPGAITRVLTTAEKAAGEATITGLTPKVTYTATLLLNTAVRGTKVFTTPAELPTGADVVVLTATDDLAAMIQAATTSTRFVVLEGTKYSSDVAVNIPAGIDISIIGEVATVKPIISLFLLNFPASPLVGGKLHFENVDITGYAKGDATTTKRQYLINQSIASTMEEVSFENCNIRNFLNTPMRIQTAATIVNKFIVNNCVADNIGIADAGPGTGTYSFVNVTGTGKINNITLTNSTFSNLGYSLVLHNAAPSLTLTVENNTFYNVDGDTRYLIDYNAQTIASGFSFKNNILGKTLSPLGTSRGIRAGTAPTTANNYQTTDAVVSASAIPGVTIYNGTSTDLFIDPANKNFKIKDDGFTGKSSAGDPRWRL